MHEQNTHDKDGIVRWRAKLEKQGAEKLEGLTGVEGQIYAGIGMAIDQEVKKVANNPALKAMSSEVLAEAILKGLRYTVDTLPLTNIIGTLDRIRETPDR